MRGKNPHALQAFSDPFIDKLRRCHDVTATRNVRRRRCWGRRISRCVSLLHCFWSRVLRTNPGNNDIKSITSALSNSAGTAGTANAVTVKQTVGLLNPDGIMAVFPTAPDAAA